MNNNNKNKEPFYNVIEGSPQITKKEEVAILKKYSNIKIHYVTFDDVTDCFWIVKKIAKENMIQVTKDNKIQKLENSIKFLENKFEYAS
ncbi:hypothetical protein NPA09_01015 [Mycoplasmopsis equigenitalium]|uniref:Uncharacterized protein n=1 Tax=Mycoplasmopsis equigenitalium TaxID=114883 RepID=A0ABY5J1M5_9BACT|nr:hypothetical protein [Mycoplasmopsis equigenitalium]UUD37141.1 hypothetical protein NPA09_01015 [Mycoplasmopsis equigenitalium]